jgi:hypothetical protein
MMEHAGKRLHTELSGSATLVALGIVCNTTDAISMIERPDRFAVVLGEMCRFFAIPKHKISVFKLRHYHARGAASNLAALIPTRTNKISNNQPPRLGCFFRE